MDFQCTSGRHRHSEQQSISEVEVNIVKRSSLCPVTLCMFVLACKSVFIILGYLISVCAIIMHEAAPITERKSFP